MLCETPIKRCDLTLVGGSKCIQYGTPFLRLGQIDHQVEWLSQGISEGWPFQGQVRKDETDEEALFGVVLAGLLRQSVFGRLTGYEATRT